jgi:tRNA-specific 2-thiouridylase
MNKTQVAIAMSGGVDSTACALLLKDQYHISGFLMDIGQPGFSEQSNRVVEISDALGIDLTIIDLKKEFDALVLDYFLTSYAAGKTPNPCIRCNQVIKLGLFMDRVLSRGFDFMATGHYARCESANGVMSLFKGIDPQKDQSYFLARLTQKQLSRVLFPLGNQVKEDTYQFVEEQGLTGFRGQESQDICFLKDTKVRSFLSSRLKEAMQDGPIVSIDGTEIGTHKGLYNYTIGQRRGLGLPDHAPWYVCGLDPEHNRLIVGRDQDLFSNHLQAISANWLVHDLPVKNQRVLAKIRYTHKGSEALISSIDDESFELVFTEPQRAVTPGQFVVLYQDDKVIGSGEISLSKKMGSPQLSPV